MIHFMRKRAAGSRRTTTALLAVAIGPAAGVALWGATAAAQAGDPPPQQPATDAHGSAAAASKPAKPDPDDRVICRDQDAPTGSRLGAKRVCLTKREWKQQEQDGQDVLKDMQHPR